LIALAVVGCARKTETPTPPTPAAAGPVAGQTPTPAAGGPAAGGSETTGPAKGVPVASESGAGGAEEGKWKTEWGPDEAKVQVEAFYPLTEEGHEWVKKYAQEIADKYPTVKVIVYDTTSDEGGAEWEGRGLTCGVWQINRETVFQRSEAVGGWKKSDLLEAVKKAVDQAKEGSGT
jgi:hypothetical protein